MMTLANPSRLPRKAEIIPNACILPDAMAVTQAEEIRIKFIMASIQDLKRILMTDDAVGVDIRTWE